MKAKMYRQKRTYLQSLFWLLLSIFSSCFNDVVTKYLTTGLASGQVCFLRFMFGSLVLLPIMVCYKGGTAFKTKRLPLHFVRGLFLSIAMGLYAYSLTQVAISTATVVGFANPIFVLILARIFLKEQVAWPIWMATWLVFIGIALVFCPTVVAYNTPVLACVLATAVFALLDVINKKYVAHEPMLSMLFFSNAMASFCMFPVACYGWQMPTLSQLAILGMLGVGSNLILYFLLKAFELSAASSLAPIRYTEWVVSILLGYLFFQEWPTLSTCLGAGIIIPSTCFIAYYQNR